MELIAQLKQQHIEILHFLESLKSEVSKKEIKENYLIEELKELRNFLLVHLMLEDNMLYPAFKESKIKKAREVGKKFSKEMLEISKFTERFFEKYSSMSLPDLLKNSKFKREVDLTIKRIKKRLHTEEEILFPAYEKYCKK